MSVRMILAVLVTAVSVGCGSSTPSAPSSTTGGNGGTGGTTGGSTTAVSVVPGSFSLTTNAYSPNPVTIAVGGTITWTNNDSIAHTSTDNGGAYNLSLPPGAQASHTFTTAGTFPYHCAIHPNMVGTVTVQ